jgi:excisionase family DNA binding protein
VRTSDVTDLSTLPVILSVAEAAKVLRLSRSQAYEYVNRGIIPCIRLGNSIRIPKARLAALLTGDTAMAESAADVSAT